MLTRGRNRDKACWKCLNYQEPDSNLFTNTWIGQQNDQNKTISSKYVIYRWSIATLVFLFLVYSLTSRLLNSSAWWKYFLYLTSWARVLAVLHYVTEAVLVTFKWRSQSNDSTTRSRLLSSYASTETRLPRSHRLNWVMANINYDTAALCTIVYWVFLYDEEHTLDVDNISGHILISLINTVDIFVSQRPWRVVHVYQTQLFCLVYVMSNFAYIEDGGTNLDDQPYIYSILDWSQPKVCIVTIIGVLLILPFIHCIFILLYKLRCILMKLVTERQSPKQNCDVELVESNYRLIRQT